MRLEKLFEQESPLAFRESPTVEGVSSFYGIEDKAVARKITADIIAFGHYGCAGFEAFKDWLEKKSISDSVDADAFIASFLAALNNREAHDIKRLAEAFTVVVGGEVHETAKAKGWWDDEQQFSQVIANIHAEVSEAWENYRNSSPPSDHIPEFTGVEEELADTIIRILDYSTSKGIRLSEAMVAKMAFNKTREHRHGGKIA